MTLTSDLAAIVGEANVQAGSAIEARYRSDLMGRFPTVPACVVRPGSTEEVSDIVKLAGRHAVSVTPVGGGTGLVGGGTADNGGILLSLERMRRIIELDARSMTMTVEAGAVLQHVHDAAEAAGLLMPLDLGARGSATIGGNISTNAGGVRVLRYGMMRDMVLGLEAVLADGTIVSALTKAIKDNTGYHWKQLLIGSEGTLGIVTRAVLRLRPLPTSTQTALVALGGFDDAADLLRRAEAALSGQLSSFELMWNDYYSHVTAQTVAPGQMPLPASYPIYALIEALGNDQDDDARRFERFLTAEMETGIALDAVVASSARQRRQLWDIREAVGLDYGNLEHAVALDVGMALADMARFVDDTRRRVRSRCPHGSVMFMGHAGDGNLHVIGQGAANHADVDAIQTAVYEAVAAVGGSISAEHGVGRAKLKYLRYSRSEPEIALMQLLKRSLDPRNLLNPGKVIDAL